ncbi:hypothetical protein EYS14_24300 [Alteromonadaceae bacterium M269]|nr:hypothetical protein EYS14_24300 [Alteromonadaceae bacterium M269]
MRLISYLFVILLVLISNTAWSNDELSDCTALRLGAASNRLPFQFAKSRSCEQPSAECDIHTTLKIPRSEFTASLMPRLLARFDACEAELRSTSTGAGRRYAETLVKEKNKLLKDSAPLETFIKKVMVANQLLSQYLIEAQRFDSQAKALLKTVTASTSLNGLSEDIAQALKQRDAATKAYHNVEAYLKTHQAHTVGRGFYPTQYTLVFQQARERDAFPKALFAPQLSQIRDLLSPLFLTYGPNLSLSKLNSEQLTDFKTQANEIADENERLFRQVEPHTYAFTELQHTQLATITTNHNRIVSALENIDALIAETSQAEVLEKQRREDSTIAIKHNNFALVASHLGYPDSRLLTRPDLL